MSEMLTVGPMVAIDGPLPVERPYSLVKTAEIVPSSDERWGSGAGVYPYTEQTPEPWYPCVGGSETKPGAIESELDPRFWPFAAVLPLFCTAGGIGSYDEFRARAIAAFTATESHAVELALATGGGSLSPSLEGEATVIGSGPVTPEVGFALLEDAIGGTARQGMIHTTPAGVTLAASRNLLERTTGNGARLTTLNGTPVVSGTGYIGAEPETGGSTPAESEAWAWATGPVQIRRSEVYTPGDGIAQVLDREVNDVTILAERNYLLTWDTALTVAVLIGACAGCGEG